MAHKSSSKKSLKLTYNGFGGIDRRKTNDGSASMSDIVNFRIMPDGSLKKRSGFKAVYFAGGIVRAIWSGLVNGNFVCYTLEDDKIFNVNLNTGTSSKCATISTTSGPAQFFYFRDALYLTDSQNIYRIYDNYVLIQTGYVPLLGKDWPTGARPGEIYEPLNILNRHARITYKAGADVTSYLPTMYKVSSVDAVYKNGNLLSASYYTVDTTNNLISVNGLVSGDSIEVNLTFTDGDTTIQSALASTTSATVFGGINNSRLFVWNGTLANTMFTTSYVSRASLEESEKRYPNSGHLYFREGHEFAVGDGRYKITAVLRHYDRLLIFTDGDTWMADSEACGLEEFPVMRINSGIGCAFNNGATVANNTPISIGRHAIYRWTSDTDELSDCNAYSISEPIADMLSENFYEKSMLYFDKRRGELWLCNSNQGSNAWIYNIGKNAWSRFTNIYPVFMFDADGNVGFVSSNTIYVFSDEALEDLYDLDGYFGAGITATFTSGTFDLGDPSYKKLTSLTLRGDIEAAGDVIKITSDRNEVISIGISRSNGHSIQKNRVHSHRMKSFSFELKTFYKGHQTIHGLEIEAK